MTGSYVEMSAGRTEFIEQWRAWLETNPDPQCVIAEMNAFLRCIRAAYDAATGMAGVAFLRDPTV